MVMEHGHRYDLHAQLLFGGRRRHVFTRLAALSGARPGDRVLDVGCGTGYFNRMMAKTVIPGGSVTGIDPSEGVITQARHLTRLAHCTFSQGIAESLDAPDGSYAVVVSSLMIHHLSESLRPQAISEMFRVLRPGGRILIADFRPPNGRLARRLIGRFVSPAMQDNPIQLLEGMTRDAGFVQVRGGNVWPWMRYVQAVKPGNIERVSNADETRMRNIDDVLANVSEHWSPRTIAVVNDYDVRVVKVRGEFTRHSHPETDEFFLVLSGALTIKMDQGDVHLGSGDTYVVPRGRFHQPDAKSETALLLFEPSDTVNTGNTPSELTAERRLT
jgi:ubiquinone/menaquinone biosynthesis C-methylase UbiE/mannose-6-phosphate isomerase-like protein (cupin superfamily)